MTGSERIDRDDLHAYVDGRLAPEAQLMAGIFILHEQLVKVFA